MATATVADAREAVNETTPEPEPANDVDLSDLEEKKPTVAGEDFAKDNKVNMWDSIRSEEGEEDLDVPPSLRAKLRGKK